MTLDDVSCLLHIPIEGKLLDHNGPLSRYNAIDLMVELLGDDVVEDDNRLERRMVLMRILDR